MNEEQNINQLPEGWKWVKLGDVCDVVTGTTPPKSDLLNYGNDIPFFKPPHLWDGTISATEEMLSFKGSAKARVVPPNTVLVTCIGNLGRTGFVKKTAAFNQQINAIIENENIGGKYIFYQAQSPLFKRQLEKLATGTTVSIVNKGNFETIYIPLPPKPTQQAIVSKIEELFSELDKGIENLRTAQQQLKTYRQSVLKWAFEGKLTNENVKEGELPKGWKWVELKEMIDKIRCGSGVVPSNEISNYPILRSSSVRTGKINFGDIKYVQKIEKIKKDDFIIKGDLLFTRLNGSIDYVGNCAKVPDGFLNNLIYPDRLFRMRLLKPEYADYIMHLFATSTARRIIEKNAKSTAGHMRISTPDITGMLIPLCPDKEQSKIVQEIESRLSVADKMEESITKSLQQAEALRQSILKKAFEGKLV